MVDQGITAIILSGGKSSRMGQDKGLMPFKGKPLISHVVNLMKEVADNIIISSNSDKYTQFGYPVVNDIYKDCGPISGIHACLEASKTEWNFVVSCDTPFIVSDLFLQMKEKTNSQDIIVPHHKGGIEPLTGLYHKRISSFLLEKIKMKEFKLQKIIKQCNLTFFDANPLVEQYPNMFCNLNSMEDLSQFL